MKVVDARDKRALGGVVVGGFALALVVLFVFAIVGLGVRIFLVVSGLN